MKVSIAVLTRNDVEALKMTVKKFKKSKIPSTKVFIIDGCSTDNTGVFLKKSGFKYVVQKERGRGNAFRLALEYLKTDYIIFYSSDGEESFDDLIDLYDKLKKSKGEYDLVIMSRLLEGTAFKSRYNIKYLPRLFVLKFFNFVANVFFNKSNIPLTDCWNGFRAIKREKLISYNTKEIFHGIELETTLKALKSRDNVVEFPTEEQERFSGSSQLPPFKTCIELFKLCFREF